MVSTADFPSSSRTPPASRRLRTSKNKSPTQHPSATTPPTEIPDTAATGNEMLSSVESSTCALLPSRTGGDRGAQGGAAEAGRAEGGGLGGAEGGLSAIARVSVGGLFASTVVLSRVVSSSTVSSDSWFITASVASSVTVRMVACTTTLPEETARLTSARLTESNAARLPL